MRLPQRDPYAPREWQPHEKPALLGSPSTPEHPTAKRIAYGVVGLLVCLTGALGNAVVTANLQNLQGTFGAWSTEIAWLPAVYVMTNVSINLLLEHDTDPVIWRGSLIAGTVKQFWTDVCWGDVDCLYVDMPPGTGDVPLTVFQSLPVDGIVIVLSPQELVGMIVEKAVKMAQMMNIPVLGLVENMAYMTCPDCGKRLYPFGEGRTADVAKQYGLPMLAQLPIQPELAKKCDEGRLMDIQLPEMGKAVDAVLKCKVRKHE